MTSFRYLGDGLFLSACALYAVNRWITKPLWPDGPLGWWFNDLLLIPCAAPICLWVERKVGLRKHDGPPSLPEILFLLFVWSLFFEWIAPRIIPWTTGDWRDAIAYTIGGLLSWAWWNRFKRAPASSVPPR